MGGENVSMDMGGLMKSKEKAVTGLTKGIEGLFKKNKVDYIIGKGKLTSKNQITVALNDGGDQVVETENVLIATGSEPSVIPGVVVDEERIVTSTGALALKEVPKRMVVIGAGVIGLEMGSVYQRIGSQVTVIGNMDRVTPGVDAEVAKTFQKSLEKQKFNFMLGQNVKSVIRKGDVVEVTCTNNKTGETQTVEADVCLLATGRRPYTDGLGLEELGIETDRRMVKIDDHFRTNVPNVYAIGDVVAGPMLAHKAEEEGIAAVEIMAGKHGHVNYNAIPGVIYTHPEVATVGLCEEDLKAAGTKYKVGKFPFMANSRARAIEDSEGLVKVFTDATTDRILGVHMVGPNVGELIAECVLGMEYGASSEDIARTCHAHPTLSEAVKEAAMAASGKAIHF
jgi:dihydrolipoamide dehydrogenase